MLALFLIIQLYPLYFVLIASISDPHLVSLNKVTLWPRGITFEGYANVLRSEGIWLGYANSLFYAVFGTAANLFFMLTSAFCMARQPAFKGKGIIMGAFVFTMYLGRADPYYLLIPMKLDNWLVMILPGALERTT